MKSHISNHKVLEDGLAENTRLTRIVSDNTSEIVKIMTGVKGLRELVLWLAPPITALGVIVAAGAAFWYWLKS